MIRNALVAVSALALAAPVAAAQSHPPGWRPFAAVFDGNAPVLLKGPVVKVEWVRPRILVHMTDAASGKAWMVEGGAPEVVTANGLSREALAPGTQIVVRGYQAKDKRCEPECLANGRDITFPAGRKLFMDATGAGAPAPSLSSRP